MKEEKIFVLAGLGVLVVIISVTVTLKKFFDNMATSGVLLCVFFLVGILFLAVLLVLEYFDYSARKK